MSPESWIPPVSLYERRGPIGGFRKGRPRNNIVFEPITRGLQFFTLSTSIRWRAIPLDNEIVTVFIL